MPLPIDRQAPGLLSAFGVKNLGKNPLLSIEQLVPVLDVTAWYLADPLGFKTASLAVNLGAIGTVVTPAGSTHVVPAGVVWLVDSFSLVTGALGAGVSGEFVPCCDYPAGGTVIEALGPSSGLIPATQAGIASMTKRDVPLFLPPGARLLAFSKNLVLGPISVTFEARYIEVKI